MSFNPPLSSWVIAGALLLTAYSVSSSFQQVNGSTDWEIRQLAYDFPHEVLHSGMTISENDRMIVPSTYTDVFARSGSGLKGKRMLDGAKLPKWSPDGKSLAFLAYCRMRGGPMCVDKANADGSHRIQLTKDHPSEWVSVLNFAWSPSGEEIAFFKGDKDYRRNTVGVVRSDGSGEKEIQHVPCPTLTGALDWSPDGQKIVFKGCSTSGFSIVVVDRTGEGAHNVASGVGPLWSPDGKMLLFHNKGLWVVNADGTEEKKILDGELAPYGLTWLPSGKSIAFASPRETSGMSEIFRINVDGTGLQKIASGSREGRSLGSPTFAPDEQELLVVGDSSLTWLLQDMLPEGRGFYLDRLSEKDIPAVLLIDLATGHEQSLARGAHPDVVWGHK